MLYVKGMQKIYSREQPELDSNGERTGDYVVKTDLVKFELDKAHDEWLDDLINARKKLKDLVSTEDDYIRRYDAMRILEDLKGWS